MGKDSVAGMTYLRGTTFNEQTMAAELTLDAVQWPAAAFEKPQGFIPAFLRSAKETLSPAAVRSFFAELDVRDPLLSQYGWILLLSLPVFAALCYSNPGSLHAANAWIKPMKFAISFSTFVWTVSLFLEQLTAPKWLVRATRQTMVASITVEMLCLSAQAWRGAAPGASTTDWLIQQMTTAIVSVNTAILVGLLVAFWGKREWSRITDHTMVLAIRFSIVIFLVGNAVGGYMLARGSHTVGAADGGPGLPFLNWSTIGGDLRIAHFIAIHAIQIVPVFAYVLSQMAPVPAVRQRKLAVAALSIVVALAVGMTFVQAAMGRPLLPLSLLAR